MLHKSELICLVYMEPPPVNLWLPFHTFHIRQYSNLTPLNWLYIVTIKNGEDMIFLTLYVQYTFYNQSICGFRFLDLVCSVHIKTITNAEGSIFPELIFAVS